MGILKGRYGWPLLAGLSCVFGFAPFGLFLVPVIALSLLCIVWLRAETPRVAAYSGFAFGVGLFGAGTGWICVALHDYGNMPMMLALLATFLFSAFLALFPALAGYMQACFSVPDTVRSMLVMPAAWVFTEWLRGMILTGFPWLAMGYAQTGSQMAGYAPIIGVYGVSLATTVGSGALAWLWDSHHPSRKGGPVHASRGTLAKAKLFAISVFLLLWAGGALLQRQSWIKPYGQPFSVALIQGNIAEDLKFSEDQLAGTLDQYRQLVTEANAKVTVLPETAFPFLRDQLPASYVQQLADHAKQNGGDIIAGVFERSDGRYYNSVFTMGSGSEQHYFKRHLVPFGEFIPLRPLLGWLINGVLDIPMGDLTSGAARQQPLEIVGQRIAVDICYEDAFGEEIIRSLPQATVLVNVTNDAWYGNSGAASQHNQMSQMRALETGRMMLRATNTGVTSIIGPDGIVLQQLPQHEEGVLVGRAQGYQGVTPYVRWGNGAVLLLIALMLARAWAASRK